jgi:hypothetical protein
MSSAARFVEVNVEPCAASEDGVRLRFKTAGQAPRDVSTIPYESEAGLAGRWRVTAVNEDETAAAVRAFAVLVEDSSDGTAWLIAGGSGGLLLEHAETGDRVREAYLVLSRTSDLDAA